MTEPSVRPRTTAGAGTPTVPDVDRVAAGAGPALDYLSRTARHLGVPDPVQEYFGPVVGRWHDLHEQAQLWRQAAHAVEELGERVITPLGALDAAWEGAVADSFVEHMRQIGAAGQSVADAMTTMAEVLDRTADAVRRLVTDMTELLSGGADRVSTAMVLPDDGERLAGRQLAEIRGYSRRMFEAVREVLEAFVETCDSAEAEQPFAEVRIANAFPREVWTFSPRLPSVPEPAPADPSAGIGAGVASEPAAGTDASGTGSGPATAGGAGAGGGRGIGGGPGIAGGSGVGGTGSAGGPPAPPAEPAVRTLAAEPVRAEPTPAAGTGAAAATGSGSGSGGRGAAGAPFMPMGMAAGTGAQDNEHRTKSRITADPTDLFGEPTKTAPPVIGED